MPRFRRKPQREKFNLPLNQHKGPPPPPDVLPWYWHPNREGVKKAPADFSARLHEIDPDLEVVFSPVHERWIIWCKNSRIQHWLCRGWQLIMLWENPVTHEYMPLSNLVFGNLYYISREKWGNGKRYYDRTVAEAKARKDAKEKTYQDERQARQSEMAGSWKISSAGQGNRAALHDSGTLVPSQGEVNWRKETRRWRLPSEVIRREKDDKERRHYGE